MRLAAVFEPSEDLERIREMAQSILNHSSRVQGAGVSPTQPITTHQSQLGKHCIPISKRQAADRHQQSKTVKNVRFKIRIYLDVFAALSHRSFAYYIRAAT